jgi:hypothetical protein
MQGQVAVGVPNLISHSEARGRETRNRRYLRLQHIQHMPEIIIHPLPFTRNLRVLLLVGSANSMRLDRGGQKQRHLNFPSQVRLLEYRLSYYPLELSYSRSLLSSEFLVPPIMSKIDLG